jgi:hypothetical protein
MSFFSCKPREQEGGQVLPRWVCISGMEEELEAGYGRMNIVQMLCTHVCKWKNDTCW